MLSLLIGAAPSSPTVHVMKMVKFALRRLVSSTTAFAQSFTHGAKKNAALSASAAPTNQRSKLMKKTPKQKTRRYADDAPLSKNELKTARSARVAAPELVAAYEAGKMRTVGRPAGSNKTAISLRLDSDVLNFFKSQGNGWQSRINNALRAIVEAVGR